MDTKQRILDEALTLFSEKGYANVFVGDIAERFDVLANLIQTSEEVKDRDNCIAAANRIIVDLNEIREMLEQNIMIVELTT